MNNACNVECGMVNRGNRRGNVAYLIFKGNKLLTKLLQLHSALEEKM